eukprot:7482358-Pyramimonas_sp.AAC.1
MLVPLVKKPRVLKLVKIDQQVYIRVHPLYIHPYQNQGIICGGKEDRSMQSASSRLSTRNTGDG